MKRNFCVLLFLTQGVFLLGQSVTLNNITGNTNPLIQSVPFLTYSPDARGMSLGEAGAATTPDVFSHFYNPAKYAFIKKKFSAAVSYTPWMRSLVPDEHLVDISSCIQVKPGDVIGVSLRYFSPGERLYFSGSTVSTFKPNEFSTDISYSKKMSETYSLGVSARYIYSNLYGDMNYNGKIQHPGKSIAFDLSFFGYDLPLRFLEKTVLSHGMNISNIGSKISYNDSGKKFLLPANFRYGVSAKLKNDTLHGFLITSEISKLLVPSDTSNTGSGLLSSFTDAPGGMSEELKEIYFSAGLEYSWKKMFFIRSGIFLQNRSKGAGPYYTSGAGIKYNAFGIDVSYLLPFYPGHPLKETVRFSLNAGF